MDLAELSTALKRHLRPGIPKYVSLREAFVESIASGSLQAGQRVPNEQDLAGALPMSLGTIQRALRELAESGVIARRPGHGSFVRGGEGDGEMAHPFHCRFLGDDGRSYLPVFPEVLTRAARPLPGLWCDALRTRNAVEVTRRIRIADEFYVYTAFYIDPGRIPLFERIPIDDLAHSNFKDVIFKSCGQAVTRIDLMVRQAAPPAKVCRAIKVPGGTPCTTIRAVGHFPGDDPIYYQHIYIPPTTRELHVVADARVPGLSG